ncbi:hypothetical protein SASPL_120303 [Salvia splendens]|uniref:X8 domain-containing protein n=1 Tax=Salvia splendens TaxID=180675 RepID=A0A8X8XSW4_SALSN|nr:mucin-5AC-like [Salvia splendens]KAG6418104.1 hypothetical protein SASPL_120303 [Salvia splendens]
MDASASNKLLFIFLLSLCSSGSFLASAKRIHNRRKLIQTTQHDTMNPPFTATPVTNPVTTPVTNPVTTPATGTYPPPLVTIPSANPVTGTPIPPATDPTLPPGGGQPAVSTYPPVQAGGQSWCVARGGVPESVLQIALDYACGIGGADCSAIQDGAACSSPTTLENHASYAFNAYYQKNPAPTSCDFGGAATLTNANPSSGSCVFPTSSSASPATVSTPGTDFSSGAAPAGFGGTGIPPTVLNSSNPALGGGIDGYGETPPTASISSASVTMAGFITCIILPLSTILQLRL